MIETLLGHVRRSETKISISSLAIVLLVFLFSSLAWADNQVAWRQAGLDIEVGVASIREGLLFPVEVVFVRTSLKRTRVSVVRAAEFGRKTTTAKEMCKERNALACINANFFDENHDPLGLVVQNGNRFKRPHTGGKTLTGIFLLSRKGPAIVHRRDVDRLAILEGVQAGPRLVVGGKIAPGTSDSESSSRSGVCIDQQGRLVLFAVSAQFFGVSFGSLAPLLTSPSVQCQDALNLDGGGSTQLFVSRDLPGAVDGFQGVDIPGRDTVPVVLALIPVKPVG